jgi:GDP-mannose 4,6-dehydratase
MRYFVTGITGFACPHLARILLRDNHEVHALIRGSSGREYDLLDLLKPDELEKIIFHYGDLKDYRSLHKIFSAYQFDGVFHLAAQSHPPTSFVHPAGTIETNVMGSTNLIDVIQLYQENCVLQFTSTSEVYGDECKDVGVLYEDMPCKPSNPYGTSKAMIDLYVQERCKNGFLKGFITRAFSHTGPRRGKNFSISWDAYHLAAMKNNRIKGRTLPVGNLETQRIVIDVQDCVRAYYELMQNFDESMNGQAYNVCGARESVHKMGYFTDKLIELSGLTNVVKEIDDRLYRPIDIQIQVGSTEKIQEAISWKPIIPIETTLADLFNYWVNKLV